MFQRSGEMEKRETVCSWAPIMCFALMPSLLYAEKYLGVLIFFRAHTILLIITVALNDLSPNLAYLSFIIKPGIGALGYQVNIQMS